MNIETKMGAVAEPAAPELPDLQLPTYLDNHATTPLDPRVLEEMMPYLSGKFGNPASRSHSFGWEAASAVDLARERVGKLIGAAADEIVFTSGATESDNLAIKGVAEANRGRGTAHRHGRYGAQGGARFLQHLEQWGM